MVSKDIWCLPLLGEMIQFDQHIMQHIFQMGQTHKLVDSSNVLFGCKHRIAGKMSPREHVFFGCKISGSTRFNSYIRKKTLTFFDYPYTPFFCSFWLAGNLFDINGTSWRLAENASTASWWITWSSRLTPLILTSELWRNAWYRTLYLRLPKTGRVLVFWSFRTDGG